MPLDPQIQVLLDQLAASGGPPLDDMAPTEARQLFKMIALLDGEPEPVDRVADRPIAGPAGDIPVRIYHPTSAPTGVLVWYHGGGWVIGDLDTHDVVCRRVTNGADAVVVSVDYRLAPEHPFPAAVEDCWAALRWVHEHASELTERDGVVPLAVGGDSAGGNLAAVIAQKAAASGAPELSMQILVYPVTDCTLSHPSMEENGEGYLLTRDSMVWFVDHYVGRDGDLKDPLVSPLYATDLDGVAPAVVVTAEFDPLRDEGEAYAERLRQAGVPVELSRYDGMIHGFFALATITPRALEASNAAAAALRRAFTAG